MTDTETVLLEICADCVQYLANYEVMDGNGNDITAEHGDRMAANWRGNFDITLGGGPAEELDADGFCEPWFSWKRCDGCGSTLGGDREYATAWVRA